jgi:hypothetical protein
MPIRFRSEIAGIEQDHLVGAPPWDRGQERVGQVAVRVDESHPAASGDVRKEEVLEQRRFAHPRLAEDGQMPQAVLRQDAESLALPSEGGHPEDREVGVGAEPGKGHRRLEFAALDGGHRRGPDREGWQVPEGRHFLG